MRVTSATALRRNLAKMIDQAADDHVPLIITRRGGKPTAVLMPLEDFESLEGRKASAEHLSKACASSPLEP